MTSAPKVEFIVTDQEAKWDKKNIFKPMLKTLPEVLKVLKEKDIWVPLSNIARLDIQGKLEDERHSLLRLQIIHFLKRGNKYKKIYFKINEKLRNKFDSLMKKYGCYQPQMKEYRALSIDLPDSMIKKGKKVWVYSYDDYLPQFKYQAPKKTIKFPTGEEMYAELRKSVEKELDDLERFRKISLKFTKILKDDVKLANKSPKIEYRSWHKQTEDPEDPEGMYYFKYKYRSKPSRDEVKI